MKEVLTPDQVADLAVIHKSSSELRRCSSRLETSGVSHATLI